MRCSYCGSGAHPVEYCPSTWSGSVARNLLRCTYCGGKDHNTDACEKKWPGPNPVRLLDK